MKKISTLLVLTLAMMGLLTGCFGGNSQTSPSAAPTANQDTAPTNAPTSSPSAPASPGTNADDQITGDDIIPDGNGAVNGTENQNDGMVGTSPDVSPSASPRAKAQ